jgi:cytochrome c-type biogenesis protein
VRTIHQLRSLVTGAVIAGLLALVVACGAGAAGGSDVTLGEPAPSYTGSTLGGGQVTLRELRGEVALVNVWATWCRPCRAEMPFLHQLSERYSAQGLRVIGVNVDRNADEQRIRSFLDSVGVTFPTVLDPRDEFGRAFATSGVPESVLIDRAGIVVQRWRGPLDTTPETTHAAVQAALAGTGLPPPADGAGVGVVIAFLAGVLSFASPCVFPLIPAYIAVITGANLGSATRGGVDQRTRRRALLGGCLFVVGFSSVFVALGASATLAGSALQEASGWIARVGGVLVILFGLHLLGILRIPLLNREARAFAAVAGRGGGAATAVLGGVTFAAGWTPCIGPILGAILTVAATRDSVYQGVGLLAMYSAGLAIPFLAASLALDRFLGFSHRFRRWLPWVERISGTLLLALGLLLVTGSFRLLAGWLPALDLLG